MAKNITDVIEQHIKHILAECESGALEIQRSELAKFFQCVPSQINYVISTRFTVERGYQVESKRGGGGYIRIKKIEWSCPKSWYDDMMERIGNRLTQLSAEGIIDQLEEQQKATEREARLMRAAVSRDVINVPAQVRDQIRANLLRAFITCLATVERR